MLPERDGSLTQISLGERRPAMADFQHPAVNAPNDYPVFLTVTCRRLWACMRFIRSACCKFTTELKCFRLSPQVRRRVRQLLPHLSIVLHVPTNPPPAHCFSPAPPRICGQRSVGLGWLLSAARNVFPHAEKSDRYGREAVTADDGTQHRECHRRG